jgi:hypothetical protein
MAGTKSQPACFSVDGHDIQNVDDLHSHFYGCLEISQRVEFLAESNPTWSLLAQFSDNRDGAFVRYTAAISILSEITRIRILRNELRLTLGKNVEESREAWRGSKEYKDNIEGIIKWSGRSRSASAAQSVC